MTSYSVSYDLVKNKDYQTLIDELERLGGHRTQASYWLVAVNNTAKELHDHLKLFMDNDDRIWVSEITNNRHYSNALGGTNAWLQKHPAIR